MKYYAFVTQEAVGVFTDWDRVKLIVFGRKRALHKSFTSFDAAKAYLLSNISEMDLYDFGLDRCPLFLNKKFVRKMQFISDKNVH